MFYRVSSGLGSAIYEIFNGYATAADPFLVAGALRFAERVWCSLAGLVADSFCQGLLLASV